MSKIFKKILMLALLIAPLGLSAALEDSYYITMSSPAGNYYASTMFNASGYYSYLDIVNERISKNCDTSISETWYFKSEKWNSSDLVGNKVYGVWSKTPLGKPYIKSNYKRFYCSFPSQEGEKVIEQNVFKTSSGSDAYCLHPGKSFTNQTYVKSEDYTSNIQNCTRSNQNYYCGLAATVIKSRDYGNDYLTTQTALRLWSAYSNNATEGHWDPSTGIKYDIKSLFWQTANAVTTINYSGSNTSIGNGILYASGNELTALRNAISIFNEVRSGFAFWSPSAKLDSTSYDSSSDILSVTISANFSINRVELSGGYSAENVSRTNCGSSNCIKFDIRNTKGNIKNIYANIFFSSSEDVISQMGLYVSSVNPNTYQDMFVFDTTASQSIRISLDSYVSTRACKKVGDKYYGPDGEEVTESVYNKKCLNACSTNPIVEVPDTCGPNGSETTGKIEDPMMCTILDNNITKDKYKTNLGNQYCDIYCRNSYTYTFMGKAEALSGRYFQYDVWSTYADHTDPNKQYLSTVVKVTKECASDIDYDKWKTDFMNAYDNVRVKWNAYKSIESQVNHTSNPITESATCNAVTADKCTRKCLSYQCKTYKCAIYNTDGSCRKRLSGDSNCEEYYSDEAHCTNFRESEGSGCSTTNVSCTYYTWNDAKYRQTNSDGSREVIDASGKSSCTVTCNRDCSGCHDSVINGGHPTMGTQKTEYDAAVRRVEMLLTMINNCNMSNQLSSVIEEVSKYINNNKLNINYEESYNNLINTEGELLLNSGNKYSLDIKYGDNDDISSYCASCKSEMSSLSATSKTDTVSKWVCEGSETNAKCSLTKVTVPANKVVNVKLTTEAIYYQNTPFSANVYTGNIVNSSGGDNRLELGTHVYPVDKQKTTDDKVVTAIYYNDIENKERTYTCTYNVISEVMNYDCEDGHHICPPGFITGSSGGGEFGLYFRTISLNKVFNASIPYNWSGVKANNAVENIESLGDRLWAETPAYSVTLSPSDISNIKKYNKDRNYLDYSLSCKGYYCTSSFLDDTLPNMLNESKIIDNSKDDDKVHLYSNR